MVAKNVDKIVSKTVTEAKLTTYTPSAGEVIIVVKTDGSMYVRVGNGTTPGGVAPLLEAVSQLPSIPFSKLTSLPTTLAGYGITDSVSLSAMNNAIDNAIAGLSWKDSVRAATTANIALSGVQTIDGVTLVAGDRVLVKNQTSAATNGIYIVNASTWTRAQDMDIASEFANSAVIPVAEGTANADSMWQMTNNGAIVVGTTALTFQQFVISPYTAGSGVVINGTQISVSGVPASAISQDANNRFVTDADKAAWNAKESAFDSIVATPIV